MTTKSKIQLCVLRDLRDMPEDYLQPDTALNSNIRLSIVPAPTLVDIEEAMMSLEQLGYVIALRDELTGVRRWQITPVGKAYLARNKF